ncbi:MAG TPA: NUDIX domain-containing protein [Vitreimonas sp.]|nr:NUDIX domain-containing protein [Vitreimonas sp.]
MPLDNQSERFIWVDEHDQVLGSISRREAHDGTHKIHRAMYVILLNTQGEILMQQRSAHKDLWPHWWSLSVAGHVSEGESYEDAAKRESLEEIGLELKFEFKGTYFNRNDKESEYIAVFTAVSDLTADQIKFDVDEVEQVRWLPQSELKSFLETHQIVPHVPQALKVAGLG